MRRTFIIIFVLAFLLGAATAAIFLSSQLGGQKAAEHSPVSPSVDNTPPIPAPSSSARSEKPRIFYAPINRAGERITKKPFGIYVSPQNSPVKPERFTGYHTGVDFETFIDEQQGDVPVFVICDGSLLVKKTASGYGGVAVESCALNEQPITLVYGHLRLSSIKAVAGAKLTVGEQIGVLGTGYSKETDGERKHLHLGIHKGNAITLRGYVQNARELEEWINIQPYL